MCQLSTGFVLNKHMQTFCTPRDMKDVPPHCLQPARPWGVASCERAGMFLGLSWAPWRLELALAFWVPFFSSRADTPCLGVGFSNLGVLKAAGVSVTTAEFPAPHQRAFWSCWRVASGKRICRKHSGGSGVESLFFSLEKWSSPPGCPRTPCLVCCPSLPTANARGLEPTLLKAAFWCP